MTDKPQISQFPKYLPKNPIFAGMSPYLKDPKNFEKIYKTIYEAGVSKCTHSEVYEYAMCVKCQAKMKKRSEVMQRLGFKSGKQYLEWLRVHQRIRDMQSGKKNAKGEKYDD